MDFIIIPISVLFILFVFWCRLAARITDDWMDATHGENWYERYGNKWNPR